MVKIATLRLLRDSGEPSGLGRSAAVWVTDTMWGPVQGPASSDWSTLIELPGKEVSMTPNIADIIRHHVSLEVRCIDRLYVNGYMPKLQTSAGLCYFLCGHRGYPIPSPARCQPIRERFGTSVHRFAGRHELQLLDVE